MIFMSIFCGKMLTFPENTTKMLDNKAQCFCLTKKLEKMLAMHKSLALTRQILTAPPQIASIDNAEKFTVHNSSKMVVNMY